MTANAKLGLAFGDITNDPMSLNRLGRLYARDTNMEAFETAAMNVATFPEDTIESALWWWYEGCA